MLQSLTFFLTSVTRLVNIQGITKNKYETANQIHKKITPA